MAYSQVYISSGHSINCQGMSDVINEVAEARKVVDRVSEIIKASGKTCYKYHDAAYSSSENLANIVKFHNQYKSGIDVSIHFNAYQHTTKPMGVEVCYYSASDLAAQMSKAIADAAGFRNRGAKQRTGLYFLKNTNKTAILIEVCFGDSIADCNLYKANFEAICRAIAKTLIGTIKVDEPAVVSGTTLELAIAVLNGKYGNGDARKKALGARYNEVQGFIDHIKTASAETLAAEVKLGKYGNGETRKKVLGARYDEVQSIVSGTNRLYHIVQSGETMYGIAKKYGITVATLQQLNGITNPNVLQIGQKLRVK